MKRTIIALERPVKGSCCVGSSVHSLLTLALTGLLPAGNLLLPLPPNSTG